MQKGQGSIEFFLIAGFILLATSVLLNQADRQITGTSGLNNVLVARSALDLEASALKYTYFSGQYATITHRIFIPINGQCFYIKPGESRMYCIVPGASGRVVGEYLDTPLPIVDGNCYRSGWLTVMTKNMGANVLNVSCS